jgi:hypothetical protein
VLLIEGGAQYRRDTMSEVRGRDAQELGSRRRFVAVGPSPCRMEGQLHGLWRPGWVPGPARFPFLPFCPDFPPVLANAFRQITIPKSIAADPTAPISRSAPNLSRLAMSNNRTPEARNVSPNNQAPILWTGEGFGDPLRRKASTARAFRSGPGQTVFRCRVSMSPTNLASS